MKTHHSFKLVIASLIIVAIAVIVAISINLLLKIKKEEFDGTGDNGIISQKVDRTQLYGSLFLDGLDTVIKNMTDPPINYDVKRIEIVRYSDVLL